MGDILNVIVGVLAVVIIVALAVLRGGPAERSAGLWMLAAWLIGVGSQFILGRDLLPLIMLASDGVVAIALLFISIQYASLWLGGAMLLQSSAFAIHAWFLTMEPADRNPYLLALSLLSYVVLLLLLGATLTRWRARTQARRRATRSAPVSRALDRAQLDLTVAVP